MKKLVCFLVLFLYLIGSGCLFGQYRYGMKAGITYYTLSGSDVHVSLEKQVGLTAGVFLNYSVTSAFSIQSEL